MQCVIVRDVAGRREFWGETGIGLDWLRSPASVWVYESKAQAEGVYRGARLGRHPGVSIVPYSEVAVRPAERNGVGR
jgi:hypothetical protein